MKEKFISIAKFIISSSISALVLAVIYRLWEPIPKWYLSQVPARGIDLFNSVSYVSYLLNHFALRVNGWKYTWFSGMPLSLDYPSFYFYLMLPFSHFFGLVRGVQIFALAGVFVFIAFSYLLFASLSKNRILAAILALGTAYSANIYKALVWAGGIPVFTTQAFFPIVLFFVVRFIQTNNRRYLALAGLLSGVGYMGHPQQFINYIFPAVVLLLLFSSYGKRFFDFEKIKNILIYGLIALLVGLPEFYYRAFENFVIPIAQVFHINLLGINPPTTEALVPKLEVIAWAKNQFYISFSDTNQVLFHLLPVLAVFFVLGLIIRKTRAKALINTVAVGLVAGWVIFYIYLLSIGINIYHGGWEAWYKLFWPVPVATGMLISQFWGVFATGVSERIRHPKLSFVSLTTLEIVSGATLIVLAITLFPSYAKGVIERLYNAGAYSSTYPEAAGARLDKLEIERFIKEAKPQLFEDSPSDYRIYSNDQTFNLWWNAYFSTPLARGYIDPPVGLAGRWGLFWMDAAFGKGSKGGTSLGDDWDTPEKVVENNISFLLDWYAVKYLEGNHFSHQTLANLADVLTSEKFIDQEEEPLIHGAIFRDANNPEKGEWEEKDPRYVQRLHFYKIKDSLVSPIHTVTNAPAVLVVGGGDSFDVMTRFIAMMGLSSQDIIAAAGPKYIDDVPLTQMMDFDALILYKYDYHNYSRIWDRIAKYLEKGGKVFIDTGPEVKESSSVELSGKFPKTLPEVFPVKQTKRGDLGVSWEEEKGEVDLFNQVNMNEFSPLEFDNKPWNISYPSGGRADLREKAAVLLSSHGYPVLVEQEFGRGKIIWSGINLPYHVLYNYNFEEGKLLLNIFSRLFEFGGQKPEQSVDWVSPEKRIISSKGAKGVLFKEEAFDGWSAKVSSQNGKSGLKIYKVGPTSPGFMYVRIPETMRNQESKVTFSYHGALDSWLANLISLIAIIFSLDYILFKSKVFKPLISRLWLKIHVKTGTWWEREEEE